MTNSYEYRPAGIPLNGKVYRDYIRNLGFSIHHHNALKKRGLRSEQIHAAGYASKGKNNVKNTVDALGYIATNYKIELKEQMVPGFSFDPATGHLKQSGVYGAVLPVRDYDGHISSLLIRPDNVKLDPSGKPIGKYVAFSSSREQTGAKVTQTTHCPIIRGIGRKVCGTTARLTEGILKADVATALDEDMYCFGLHGLKLTSDLGRVIVEAEIDRLILAVDCGEDENDDMKRIKVDFLKFCQEQGIDGDIELWDPEYGKGIDDVLANGHKDKIRLATEDEKAEILQNESQIKPSIQVYGGGLSEAATIGEAALINTGLPIYARGPKLVTPVTQHTEAAHSRTTKIAALHEINKPRMVDHLCDVATWYKVNEAGDPYFINPPANIADTILNRFGMWSFPTLAGVIMTPTLRPDGSLLRDVGYDDETRLYLLDTPDMPDIPDNPSRDDALKALELLDELLVDFPFIDEAAKSVALSALITPIVRGACKVVPMHVVCAPTPGTGKSYLLDTVSAIAIGQPCPVIAAGRNEEETEKRLGAALLTGQPLLSIDNLNGDLGGDALCQHIERPSVNVRILGKSEQATIESRTCIYANGNNIRLKGDITRRAVQSQMDAKLERPELRAFKLDPVKTVLNDRGKYIAAILTIVRAYIVAGKPDVLTPRLGSFEEWSDLVRSSLVWLGREDPLTSMEAARTEDPTLQAISEVFTALWDVSEGQPLTAKQIVGLAVGGDNMPDPVDTCFNDGKIRDYAALKEALENVAADQKGFITAKRLGHWFSRHKGRMINNMRLENEVDNHGHPAKWWLVKSGSAD